MLALVDANNIFHATCHALLTHEQVGPTQLVDSFLYRCQNFAREYDQIIFVFDGLEAKYAQRSVSSNYKGNRDAAPDSKYAGSQLTKNDVARLFRHGRRLLAYAGYPTAYHLRLEGDQIIGDLALRNKDKEGVQIISVDKDFNQLISEKVTVFNPISKKVLDSDYVVKRYGVQPQQFALYLALVGDKIDNVPGIPGIGPKNAVTLIHTYGGAKALIRGIRVKKRDGGKLERTEKLVIENLEQFKDCLRVVKLGRLSSGSYRVKPGSGDPAKLKAECLRHGYKFGQRRKF